MSKQPNFGKSLSGYTPLSNNILETLGDSIASVMSNGITLNNVTIVGGTIDGVTTGNSSPGPIYATNVYSGAPGTGYSSCFYGNNPGESACWIPNTGTWNIHGDLSVTDQSNFGNLQILGNTISSTNVNGNVFITPTGTGKLNINAPINQTTSDGNLIFGTTNGFYTLDTSSTIALNSGTDASITTQTGNITLSPGLNVPNKAVTFITTGTSTITVTTSTNNGLSAGDQITLSGTNNGTDGNYTISSVLSNTSFVIPVSTPVLTTGTTGNVLKRTSIYLNSSDNVYIPQDTKLTLGNTSNLYYNGTNTVLDTGTGNLTLNGDLVVNGNQTYIKSTVVSIDDPVFNLGGTTDPVSSDLLDRGISGKYFNGTAKTLFFGKQNATGCFTYIPDATEVSPNIFTGTPGCASFGNVTTTGISISSGGTITGLTSLTVPTLNTCNISCSGVLTLTGSTSISLATPTVNTNNIVSSGSITGNSGSFTGNVSSGSTTTTGNTTTGTLTTGNTTINGTQTVNGSSTITGTVTAGNANITGTTTTGDLSVTNNATVANNTTTGTLTVNTSATAGSLTVTTSVTSNSISSTTGTIGTLNTTTSTVSGTETVGTLNVTNNAHIYGNLTVDGTSNLPTINSTTITTTNLTATNTTTDNLTVNDTTNVKDLNITGTITGLPFTGMTIEHLSVSGGSNANPSNLFNTTFVTVTSVGIATGSLPNGPSDGFVKYIFISSCVSGGSYKLTCTNNLVDIGTGTTASKILTFKTAGYSIALIWDLTAGVWLFINAGVCISGA